MKIIIMPFMLLVLASPITLAQSTYNTNVRKADSLYRVQNYQKSVSYYEKAFSEKAVDAKDLYNAACASALAGKYKLSFQLLNKAIDNGWSNLRHLEDDNDLASLHSRKEWTDILLKLKKLKEKREAEYDKPLYNELVNILENDQQVRKKYIDATKELGSNSTKADSLMQVMAANDKMNVAKIIKILDNGGWPSRQRVGDEGILAAFVVIQHADLLTQERYFPAMKLASERGDLKPEALAILEDRIQLGKGKKQIYGSQIGQNRKTGVYYVLPLESPENVDQMRLEIGLPPMKIYVSRWGIKWSLEDYEKGLEQREERKIITRPKF